VVKPSRSCLFHREISAILRFPSRILPYSVRRERQLPGLCPEIPPPHLR
jgi:hypothetical protein